MIKYLEAQSRTDERTYLTPLRPCPDIYRAGLAWEPSTSVASRGRGVKTRRGVWQGGGPWRSTSSCML